MNAVEWAEAEREAVGRALADIEGLPWGEPGDVRAQARQTYLMDADHILAALAPHVAARQSALWCDGCGCNNGEGGPTCTCGVCRCATEAEVEHLRATVARVEMLRDEWENRSRRGNRTKIAPDMAGNAIRAALAGDQP